VTLSLLAGAAAGKLRSGGQVMALGSDAAASPATARFSDGADGGCAGATGE